VAWEYKMVRLARPEQSASWEAEGELYSVQLTAIASYGWEVLHVDIPWVLFQRTRVETEREAEEPTPGVRPMGRGKRQGRAAS
jgi:hypothetical protein